MLSVHNCYATKNNHKSIKPLHLNNKYCAPCLSLWCIDAQLFLHAHTSQNKAIVVTMANKV